MGFWRPAAFDGNIIRSPWICWVIVAIIYGFLINTIAISVMLPSRRRATIGRFSIEWLFIRAVAVGTLSVREISVGTTGVRISIAVIIPPIWVGSVRTVIIRIVIGLRWTIKVIGALGSFLQDGPDWFVLR